MTELLSEFVAYLIQQGICFCQYYHWEGYQPVEDKTLRAEIEEFLNKKNKGGVK